MQGLTKQEMFDRAVRGLRGQGWQQAIKINCHGDSNCVYYDEETGRRCAWGHVDPEGTRYIGNVNVWSLYRGGVGLAKLLDEEGVSFASSLQDAHDAGGLSLSPEDLEQRLRDLGTRYNLTWPE